MELGVQLFGSMELFRKDIETYLKKIKSYGYTEIEPCVIFGMTKEQLSQTPFSFIWLPEDFPEIKNTASTYGIAINSCHIFADPQNFMSEIIAMAKQNSIKRLVMNCISEKDNFGTFTNTLEITADALAKENIELWLHNGQGPVAAKYGDESLYEAVLKKLSGKVGAQVDVGWVEYDGVNVIELLKNIQFCLRSIHYKDLKGSAADYPPHKVHTALGKGILDTKNIQSFIKDIPEGLPKIVEIIDQDASDGDFMEDLKFSAETLKK